MQEVLRHISPPRRRHLPAALRRVGQRLNRGSHRLGVFARHHQRAAALGHQRRALATQGRHRTALGSHNLEHLAGDEHVKVGDVLQTHQVDVRRRIIGPHLVVLHARQKLDVRHALGVSRQPFLVGPFAHQQYGNVGTAHQQPRRVNHLGQRLGLAVVAYIQHQLGQRANAQLGTQRIGAAALARLNRLGIIGIAHAVEHHRKFFFGNPAPGNRGGKAARHRHNRIGAAVQKHLQLLQQAQHRAAFQNPHLHKNGGPQVAHFKYKPRAITPCQQPTANHAKKCRAARHHHIGPLVGGDTGEVGEQHAEHERNMVEQPSHLALVGGHNQPVAPHADAVEVFLVGGGAVAVGLWHNTVRVVGDAGQHRHVGTQLLPAFGQATHARARRAGLRRVVLAHNPDVHLAMISPHPLFHSINAAPGTTPLSVFHPARLCIVCAPKTGFCDSSARSNDKRPTSQRHRRITSAHPGTLMLGCGHERKRTSRRRAINCYY